MKEYIAEYETEQIENSTFFYGGKIKRKLIRCKDCIHHHGYTCDRLYGLQDAFTLQDDDYCSRAEPKEKP